MAHMSARKHHDWEALLLGAVLVAVLFGLALIARLLLG